MLGMSYEDTANVLYAAIKSSTERLEKSGIHEPDIAIALRNLAEACHLVGKE